nr:hypothetical protein [uncultured Psychroserpens sp.]
MLTISPSISNQFSYRSFVFHHINMIGEMTIKNLNFLMISKSVLQEIEVISPIIIEPSISKNKKNSNEPESNFELFQRKLRKNLETLTFLAELEPRYDVNKGLPKFIDECNAIKIEVQQKTIELTKKLASYKNLHTNKTASF